MPSKALKGLSTESGWTITEELTQTLGSGGNFCCRYLATNSDGKVGFLKAMDLSKAFGDLRDLQKLIDVYLFEQDILYYCKEQKMTKVVTPLDAGQIKVPNFQPPLDTVYYVIFENAEGDLRKEHFEAEKKLWLPAFKALHHVAIGAHQLHKAGIAHQDIKPSNVLRFNASESKISDLGRVTDENGQSPFSGMLFTGDSYYAPPEVSFGIHPQKFSDRYCADVYMIGSLVYHLISDVAISSILFDETEKIIPNVRGFSYEEALPFMQTAFSTIISRYQRDCVDKFGNEIAIQLSGIVTEMCNPDMLKRGFSSRKSKGLGLSMNRYVGKFSNLVRRAIVEGVQ